ncbi:hypothetical protein JTB14_009699 [Gonioctena quinquepunctata]|nr:hypothetical protein JTB14_009699 [Gonioctena quinquepunctata]
MVEKNGALNITVAAIMELRMQILRLSKFFRTFITLACRNFQITDDLSIVKKDNPGNVEERGFSDDIFRNSGFPAVPTVLLDLQYFSLKSRSTIGCNWTFFEIGEESHCAIPVGTEIQNCSSCTTCPCFDCSENLESPHFGTSLTRTTGALVIFKFTKPKVVNYEIVHVPHHHEHHVDHVEHVPSSGWDHPGYGRQLTGNEMAYQAHLN